MCFKNQKSEYKSVVLVYMLPTKLFLLELLLRISDFFSLSSILIINPRATTEGNEKFWLG